MSVSLKAVAGVGSVDVSLAKGLASVKLKPGNTTTLQQLQTAITKNGFTMKDSSVTVAGTVVTDAGKFQLKISGSNETVELIPKGQTTGNSFDGKSVIVTGVVPETAKNKKAFSIQYQSITESK